MDYFAEKAHQVTGNEFQAFGISLMTRYGKADELVEMINFARLAAMGELHLLVKTVFYDSKANLCTIELFDESLWNTEEGIALRKCAKQSIRQFQWDGTIGHGLDLLESDDMP
jgi:hypothetical protein